MLEGDTESPLKYAAMVQCEGRKLAPSDYFCSVPAAGPTVPAPKETGACKTEICAWICDPDVAGGIGLGVDPNVQAYCACP
jgi:hypothetical protein